MPNSNLQKSSEPLVDRDPCSECGEGFTLEEAMNCCSYGLDGDVHEHCCRRHNDPFEDGCE